MSIYKLNTDFLPFMMLVNMGTAQMLLKMALMSIHKPLTSVLPFMLQNGRENIVQLLLKNGADVNLHVLAIDGRTPLFTAFYNGHEGMRNCY